MSTLPATYLTSRVVRQIEQGTIPIVHFLVRCVSPNGSAVLDEDGTVRECAICLEKMDPNDPEAKHPYDCDPGQECAVTTNPDCGCSLHYICAVQSYDAGNVRCPTCGVEQYDTAEEIDKADDIVDDIELMYNGELDKNVPFTEKKVTIVSNLLTESIHYAAYFLLRTKYIGEDKTYAPDGIAAHPDGRAIVQEFHDYALSLHDSRRFIEQLRDQVPDRIVSRAMTTRGLTSSNDAMEEFAHRLSHLALHHYGIGSGTSFDDDR